MLYSAKFLRRIIFTVFTDLSLTVKIKFLKTFRLNCSGGRGMVWTSRAAWHSIVVSQQTLPDSGGHLRKFLQCPLRLSMGTRLQLERCSWWAPMNETEKTPDEVRPWAKHFDLEASSWGWGIWSTNSVHNHLKWVWLMRIPSSTKFISAKICKMLIRENVVPRKFGTIR